MKNSVKHLAALFSMLTFLIFGLTAGVNVEVSSAFSCGSDCNGWVCGSSPGSCEENYNVTQCTWTSEGCTDGPVVAPDKQ